MFLSKKRSSFYICSFNCAANLLLLEEISNAHVLLSLNYQRSIEIDTHLKNIKATKCPIELLNLGEHICGYVLYIYPHVSSNIMATTQNGETLEIRNDKKSNLFYAVLGLVTIIIINIKTYPAFKSDTNLFWLAILISTFFGLACIYFIFKAMDKEPICKIDTEKIIICKTGSTYDLNKLKFYRRDEVSARYTTINFLHFYDSNKTPVFKIHTTNTDLDYMKFKNLLKGKLSELT